MTWLANKNVALIVALSWPYQDVQLPEYREQLVESRFSMIKVPRSGLAPCLKHWEMQCPSTLASISVDRDRKADCHLVHLFSSELDETMKPEWDHPAVV